jgi:AAA family ATP:ADP antiporter
MTIQKYIPIKKDEFSRFLVVSLMMALIVLIYSAQRIIKDTMVVSYMGSELISTIKLYGVLPAAVIVMLVYAKLSNIFKKTVIFHGFNIFFIAYFVLFTFVLYPNVDKVHFDFSNFSHQFPHFKYIFIMMEGWSYSVYYIFAELWGSVMLALMFWQTANQVFKISEAKRLYPLFGFMAQLGVFGAGGLVKLFVVGNDIKDGWQGSLKSINSSIVAAAVLLSILFFILSNVLVSSDIINAETVKKKKKMGFFEGLKYVFTSKYIGLIVTLILCYGISINLVEGVWKAQAKVLYSNASEFANFMSGVQIYTGVSTMVAMLAGSYIIRLVPWKFAALLTPIVIFVTGSIFFAFSIFQIELMSMMTFITVAPVVVAVSAGSLQNILSKGTKYAFFDSTKEMAYIPLDEALKSKGKAAADVIGGRLGKSGGAFIQFIMLSMIAGSSLISLAPNLFVIFVFIIIIWFVAAHLLSKEFNKLAKKNDITKSN